MSWFTRLFKRKEVIVNTNNYPKITIDDIKVNDNKLIELKLLVDKFKSNKERYASVSESTGVPSDVIFACHYRESSLDFKTCLHNGDALPGPTHHVPKGRGPFKSWEDAAIDALNIEKAKFPSIWDLVGKLNFCEKYNGMGYANKGVPSPYVFSWTNKYIKGKYVADGKYDSDFVDQQCGTAAIILGISADSHT